MSQVIAKLEKAFTRVLINLLIAFLFQLEPNPECSQGFKFSNGYNCVGFFSIGILSSLFVTFILAGGLFIGIMMMMLIQTPERFDDPKGPTITVPSTD